MGARVPLPPPRTREEMLAQLRILEGRAKWLRVESCLLVSAVPLAAILLALLSVLG